MSRTCPRYSEEESNIILEEIKNSPDNILEACRKAVKRIKRINNNKRTDVGCANHYYRILKEREEIFTVKSDNKTLINVKNTPVKKQINFKSQLLHSLIDELTPTEKFELSKKLISSL